MKVKEGTPTDISLREVFARKTGNTKPLGNDPTSDLPQETVTLTDIELIRKYDKYTFPIGVTKDREPVTFEINKDDFPTNILISGAPGAGKTVMTEQILRKAEIEGIPVLKWNRSTGPISAVTEGERKNFNIELEKIFSGEHDVTQPTIVIIDSLEHYLALPWDSDNYHQVKNWQDNISELGKLLRLSRSKNVIFVMTAAQRQTHYYLEMISSFITTNIVGHLDTVSSTLVLGTNEAVKLKNGNFIIKTGKEAKVIKAYHPAMKSDWI